LALSFSGSRKIHKDWHYPPLIFAIAINIGKHWEIDLEISPLQLYRSKVDLLFPT